MDECYLLRPKEEKFLKDYDNLTLELQKVLQRVVFFNDGQFSDEREKKLNHIFANKEAYKHVLSK